MAAVADLGRTGKVFVFGSGVDMATVRLLQPGDGVLQGVAGYISYQTGSAALNAALSVLDGTPTEGTLRLAPTWFGRADQAQVDAFLARGGYLVLSTPFPVITPAAMTPVCDLCSKAPPVIPTPR